MFSLLARAADKCGMTAFSQNHAIVKKYTTAELSRAQFNTYCTGNKSGHLLSSYFGTDAQIQTFYREYEGGVPEGETLQAYLVYDILAELDDTGVTLDAGPAGSEFRARFEKAFRTLLVDKNRLPYFPETYLREPGIRHSLEKMMKELPQFAEQLRHYYSFSDARQAAGSPSAVPAQAFQAHVA